MTAAVWGRCSLPGCGAVVVAEGAGDGGGGGGGGDDDRLESFYWPVRGWN